MKPKKVLIYVSFFIIAAVLFTIGFKVYHKGYPYWKSRLICYIFKPRLDFDPVNAPAAPNYANSKFWAALPDKIDEADFVPVDVNSVNNQQTAKVNVFFIHPTALYGGQNWNSRMEPESKAGENIRWMRANQASVFNGCCKVYAPRCRDAVILYYLPGNNGNGEKALDFAYYDVERAFDYFLEHYSKDEPFIIASHSQGTRHGQRLVKERIGGTPLVEKMIVAYLIGGGVKSDFVDEMADIHACNDATDIHCIVHWATIGDGSDINISEEDQFLCTNPISWNIDEERAPKSQHKGAVPVSGRFNFC